MKNIAQLFFILCLVPFFIDPQEIDCSTYLHDVAVGGFILDSDGIGSQPIGLIDCLEGFKVNFVNTRTAAHINLQDVPEKIKKVINSSQPNAKSYVSILEDFLYTPHHRRGPQEYYKKMPESLIKLAYTMFESDRIPDEWVEILNSNFDAAIVPNEFLVPVYKNSGVTVPIFVLPLGIYMQEFLEQPLPQYTQKPNPVIFLHSGTFCERKNQLSLLEAFASEFGNLESVKLILHGREGLKYFKKLQERVQELNVTNVELRLERLSRSAYTELISSCHIYVTVALGEGVDIPLHQALAAGKEAVVSNNTAHTTICNTGLVYPVESTIKQPAFYPHLNSYVGYNWQCTKEDIQAALRKAYEEYPRNLHQAPARRAFAAQYSYSNKTLRTMYRSLVKPKRVFDGPENIITKDGYIITNCPKLRMKYSTIGLQNTSAD
jgi:glycosyltransferase involved in cell wall biosynthesis